MLPKFCCIVTKMSCHNHKRNIKKTMGKKNIFMIGYLCHQKALPAVCGKHRSTCTATTGSEKKLLSSAVKTKSCLFLYLFINVLLYLFIYALFYPWLYFPASKNALLDFFSLSLSLSLYHSLFSTQWVYQYPGKRESKKISLLWESENQALCSYLNEGFFVRFFSPPYIVMSLICRHTWHNRNK